MAMEDSGMMSPADIAALTRGNTGFGGDGISWLVLILLFFGFMGGGWGGRYGNGELGQYATAASQQDILFGQLSSKLQIYVNSQQVNTVNVAVEVVKE